MLESWAIPTWIFFHTLAEKINENFLKNNSANVLQIIKSICHNLPCPTCRQHATLYMSRIDINHIDSKEKIKNMFFVFHNSVNKRLGKQQYGIEGLNRYKYGRFDIIYIHFINNFSKKYGSVLLGGQLSQNSKRRNLKINLNSWFKKNWNNFQ